MNSKYRFIWTSIKHVNWNPSRSFNRAHKHRFCFINKATLSSVVNVLVPNMSFLETLISSVLLICLSVHLAFSAPQCQLAKNCVECMGRGPMCSWCFDENYDDTAEGPGYRCAEHDTLIDRKCSANMIEFRNSTIIDGKV